VDLPFDPPVPPGRAKVARAIPRSGEWLFEPKWDGFRAIVFRDGDEVFTQSRDLRPLDRYFPELARPLRRSLPDRCVVDGEIVVVTDRGLDFDSLQMRLHPAESRVDRLSREIPAAFVAFDLLARGGHDLRGAPFRERRSALEEALADAEPPVMLTPATSDPDVAAEWFRRFEGAGLDGVIAKDLDGVYQPKKRVLLKIKHVRTADCVVAGFRWHKNGPGTLVGSLLLGLYDEDGVLHHVGITSAFKMATRKKLAEELAPLAENALEDHPWAAWATEGAHGRGQRLPGGPSRWSRGKDLSFVPLRIERVCEVKYDYMQGDRFRHATTFLRWRTDKQPSECTYAQLERPAPIPLSDILPVASG